MYYTYYTMYKKKTITIKKEHEDWIEKNNINLSRFVQMCIQKKINTKK